MRKRHLFVTWPLLLVAALAATVVFVFATETGLRSLLAMGAKYAPGELQVGQVDGRLVSPLVLHNVDYRLNGTHIHIERLAVEWRLNQLFDQKIHIKDLHASGVRIQTAPQQAPPPESGARAPLPNVALPVTAAVDNLQVDDVQLLRGEQELAALDRIAASARYNGRTLFVDRLQLASAPLDVSAEAQVTPTGDYPLEAQILYTARPPGYAPVQGTLETAGSLRRLQISHATKVPFQSQLTAVVHQVLEQPRWDGTLRIEQLTPARINAQWPAVPISGQIRSDGTLQSFAVNADLEAIYQDLQSRLQAGAQVTPQQITIEHLRLAVPAIQSLVEARGMARFTGDAPSVDLSGEWQHLRWPLTGTPQARLPEGTFQVTGTPESYRFSANTAVATERAPVRRIRLAGTGDTQAITLAELQASGQEQFTVAGNGRVQWQPQLAVAFDGRWSDFTFRDPAGAPLLTSTSGQVHVEGQPEDYRFQVQAEVDGAQLPQGSWRVAGNGSTRQVEIAQLTAQTLDGTLQARGSVQWQPAIQWRAQLSAAGVNPGVQWPQWAGNVTLDLNTNGRLQDGSPYVEAQLSQLSGTLRELAVDGTAQVVLDGETLLLTPLVLQMGQAHLVAAGRVGDSWDLSWQLEAPNLNRLYQAASGSVRARGSLAGDRMQPRVEAFLDASGLAFRDYRAGNVRARLDWDPQDATPSAIAISAEQLAVGNTTVNTLSVTGNGRTADHRIQLQADTSLADAQLQLTGGYANNAWQGTLSQLQVEADGVGQWSTTRPAELYLSPQQVAAERTCLHRDAASVCLQGRWNRGGAAQAAIEGEQLNLSMLDPWLPSDVVPAGEISLSAEAAQTAAGQFTGKARIASDSGRIRFQVTREETAPLEYRGLLLTARLDPKGVLRSQVHADLTDAGNLEGSFRINVAALRNGQPAPIRGALKLSLNQFGMVPILVPQIESPSGELRADVAIAGTTAEPALNADLKFTDGSVTVPALGIQVNNIRIAAETTGRRTFAYGIHAESGPGQVEVRGSFQMAEQNWSTQLTIEGERFQAIDTSEVRALVSPELSVALTPTQANVTGVIRIPEATITPKDLGGAITASRDVVIVEPERPQEAQKNGMTIDSIVRLELGEKVKFEGFGLRGDITGNLVIMDQPGQLTRAIGELQIKEGKYRAYGQRLDIERGRLVYVGGPVDDPGLDIRAVRKVDEVTAGINVQGTLRSPQLTTFSDPAMPGTDVLSYLQFGRPLNQTSQEEGQQVQNLAQSAGIAGLGLLAEQLQLQERLSVDELRVEDGALQVGEYISPKLYVGYGRDIANQLNKWFLRYSLSSKWTLEGESSGESIGADLLYTLESE